MINKKTIEMVAASIYLKSLGLQPQEVDFELEPDEPADIIYIPTQEKYQVTQAQGEIGKLLNKGAVSFQHTANQTFQEFVDIAVKRKLKKYGGGSAVSDVTLLIYDLIEPPWLERSVEESKKDLMVQKLLRESGFREIYCVFNFPASTTPLKIYPFQT